MKEKEGKRKKKKEKQRRSNNDSNGSSGYDNNKNNIQTSCLILQGSSSIKPTWKHVEFLDTRISKT